MKLVAGLVAGAGALQAPRRVRASVTMRGAGLVLGNEVGAIGSESLGGPVVHAYRDGQSPAFAMYYHGRGGLEPYEDALPPISLSSISTGRLAAAVSEDGLTWTRVPGIDKGGALLAENHDEWWAFDSAHIGLGDVVSMTSGKDEMTPTRDGAIMYTFGGSNEEMPLRSIGVDEDGSVSGMDLRIGSCATQGWVGVDRAPLFARVEGEHANGQCVDAGLPGEWDSTFVAWPSVVRVGAEWIMWYHALDSGSGRYAVGSAKSKDGFRFTKIGTAPCFRGGVPGEWDGGGVTRRCVRRVAGAATKFTMWYEGQDLLGNVAIGVATSMDGQEWRRRGEPVFKAADDDEAWDGGQVAGPNVVRLDDTTLRMYYTGRRKNQSNTAIGAADSTDGGLTWTRVATA